MTSQFPNDPDPVSLGDSCREIPFSPAKHSEVAVWAGSFYVSPGFVQERMTIFLAEDLTPGEARL